MDDTRPQNFRPVAALGSSRGPISTPGGTTTRIPPGLQAKMAALAARSAAASSDPSFSTGLPQNFNSPQLRARLPQHKPPDVDGATAALARSSIAPRGPAMKPPAGIAARRAGAGLKLSGIAAGPVVGGGASGAGLGPGRPNLNDSPSQRPTQMGGTPFSNFDKIVDPSGALRFAGKAVLNASGVSFGNGNSFSINMSEFTLDEELGRGNYGTVKKVFHKPTNVVMAMKEIRLELDSSKLNSILVELDILHRATCPEIVDFYGAFFIESCVYYCMEYMDAGSLDKLIGFKPEGASKTTEEPSSSRQPSGDFDRESVSARLPGGTSEGGIQEDVLARITSSMVRGLKFLKDELNVMHRDVKPTNVLVNRKGQIKLCDFGVSGQLERSLAKTNIGCQSYMAPERIHGEAQNKQGTYSVSSDVWSLGLSIVELALGRYPYPPEMYSNVFAQLTAIVHGPSPLMPTGYSDTACDFVDRCLLKDPSQRPTYAELLEHPWLSIETTKDVDMVRWVESALQLREAARKNGKTPRASNGNE